MSDLATNKVLKDISETIEKHGAWYAWYELRKGGKTMALCYDLLKEINFYIEPEAVDKAERLMKSERAALTQLNQFFSNI